MLYLVMSFDPDAVCIPASTNAAFFLVQNDCAITGTNYTTATLIPRLPTLLPQALQPLQNTYSFIQHLFEIQTA